MQESEKAINSQTLKGDAEREEFKDVNQEEKLTPPSSEDKLQKLKRRTRYDNSNRNFSCGCGKNYLSYPALYTHLK